MITRRDAISSAVTLSALPLQSADVVGAPKICLEVGGGSLSAGSFDEAGFRRIKQLGIDYVVMGGPKIPWNQEDIRSRIDQLQRAGLTLFNMMIGGFPKTLYGQPGRDEEIEQVKQSIRAAGRAGLPVIEYNFYAHRAVEGYYEETGRGGAGLTAFGYERVAPIQLVRHLTSAEMSFPPKSSVMH